MLKRFTRTHTHSQQDQHDIVSPVVEQAGKESMSEPGDDILPTINKVVEGGHPMAITLVCVSILVYEI